MKRLVAIVSPIALFLAMDVPTAHASWLGDAFNSVGGFLNQVLGLFTKPVDAIIGVAAYLINSVIGLIGWLLFNLGAAFIDFSIKVNNHIAASPVVKEGYASTLNLTNLLFVVAIVVIAFATILRRQNYAMSKALPRLIIVALLINFSMPIATTIIGVSNDITKSLIDQGGGLKIGDLNNFWQNSLSGIGDISTWTATSSANDIAVNTASTIFSALFVLIGAFTLIAIAVMLLIRYVTLSLLLVLMPVAVALLVFPGLEIPGGHPWKAWWGQFIRWVLFGPVTVFFFILAVQVVSNRPSQVIGGDISAGTAAIGDMITVLGLLLGGVFVANKLSITGAHTFDAGINWTMGKGGEFMRKRQTKLEGEIKGQQLAGKEPSAAKKLQLNLYKSAAGGIERGQKAILGTVGGKAEVAKFEKPDRNQLAEQKRRFILSEMETDEPLFFRLDSNDINELAKGGSYDDKQRINTMLSALGKNDTKLTEQERVKLKGLRRSVTNAITKGDWPEEEKKEGEIAEGNKEGGAV